jgi:hypothetical protein
MTSPYAIGTTYETLTPLDELTTPVIDPTPSFYDGELRITLGNGQKKWVGAPWAALDFALLTVDQRNQLREFCADGSAEIYLTTRKNDDTFVTFSGIMWWPDEDQRALTDDPANLRVEFHNLVEVEGS